MAENKAVYYGTGRRKTSVARVRLMPGTGVDHRQRARPPPSTSAARRSSTSSSTPFKVTETVGRFDVIATIHGGGVSGQAGALRHGIARALLEAGDEYRGELKRPASAPRPAYGRAQEVRPEEGPQAAAVLQALGAAAAYDRTRPGLAASRRAPSRLQGGCDRWRRLFGTDGVRGIANAELTPELAFRLGEAAGHFLGEQRRAAASSSGRDTRAQRRDARGRARRRHLLGRRRRAASPASSRRRRSRSSSASSGPTAAWSSRRRTTRPSTTASSSSAATASSCPTSSRTRSRSSSSRERDWERPDRRGRRRASSGSPTPSSATSRTRSRPSTATSPG